MCALKKEEKQPLWRTFRKKGIAEAVVQILCAEGIDAITMERVAEKAGIGKGTIYLHYKDKQRLLDEVKAASLAPIIEKIDELYASSLPPARKLEAFSLRYLAYFDEHRDLFRVLLYEREHVRSRASRYRSDRYRQLLDGTAAVIESGIADGVFRRLDSRKIAAMFIESHIALVGQRLLGSDPMPVEEDARMAAELFLHGMMSPETPQVRTKRRARPVRSKK